MWCNLTKSNKADKEETSKEETPISKDNVTEGINIMEEIKEQVKKEMLTKGEDIESDFDEDFNDAISDMREDEPSMFLNLEDKTKRNQLVAKIVDELEWGGKYDAIW